MDRKSTKNEIQCKYKLTGLGNNVKVENINHNENYVQYNLSIPKCSGMEVKLGLDRFGLQEVLCLV